MELYIVLGFIVLLAGLFYWQYVALIVKKNKILEAWAAVDVQLKKRFDLIPNLVAAVKGYADHENDVLNKIVETREGICGLKNDISNRPERFVLENNLSNMIPDFLAKVEAYPDLHANENFLQLQNSLKDVEGHIAAARRFYNSAVNDFNNSVEVFPSSLIASFLGLKGKSFYSFDDVK